MKALRPYLIGAALGLVWFLWHPVSKRETAAFEKALPSGGMVLQRDPAAKQPAPVKRAAREVGGKLERSVSVTVQPKPVQTSAEPACSCGPVTVDLGLVRLPDDSRRVVATSPDGEVVGGVDIPIGTSSSTRSLRWAVGATWEPQRREFGAFVDRDLGPFRVGLEVKQRDAGVTAVLRAGIRF